MAAEGEEVGDRFVEVAPGLVPAIKAGDFTGKRSQVVMGYATESKKVARVALLGAGKPKKLTLEVVRRAAAKVIHVAKDLKAEKVGVVFEDLPGELGDDAVAAAIGEACVLANYKFVKHKSSPDKKRKGMRTELADDTVTPAVTIFTKSRGAKAAVNTATAIARASNRCRDIADQPGNHATPTILAEHAKRWSKEFGFKLKVLDEAQMKKLGMNSLLAVSAGSSEPAKLIIMEHKPKGAKETIVLVGKGLTFDAGGISIKPADRMWEMKYDKCGGCAVLGAMTAIAELNLPFHVVGLVPSSENMPDGSAVKPGDIVKSLTGHNIEILNTDAEGRLIMADALGYAHRYKPSVVVDFATLTGACVVALASIRAGVMGDAELSKDIVAAGDRVGEKCWPLPLDDEYHELLKSDHADVKNIGGRWGGAITAGCFLSNFVPPTAKWAHIDLAGPAWKMDGGGGKEYLRRGATGFGVRLIVDFLRNRAEG